MADEMLPNAIFASMQKLMIGAAEAIEDIDPDGKIISTFIGQCRQSGSVAFVIDPTLYIAGHEALDALGEVASAALKLLQAKQRWQKASDAGREQLERRTAGARVLRDLGLA